MIKRLSILCIVVMLASMMAAAQRTSDGYTIMFYNMENLFDTIDDPHCNDNEYLPDAKNAWNSNKYWTKLSNLSKVIASVDTIGLPILVGVSEIENRTVLEDLCKMPDLVAGQYKVIHEESNDPRCIDVGLLYRPDVFKELSHAKIPIIYSDTSTESARECLYVCGIIGKKDTLHVIVNHWKSRTGGTEQTEPKRIAYAIAIRKWVDSLFVIQPNAKILLMGDFNDTPKDRSIKEYLVTDYPGTVVNNRVLLNLTAALADSGIGSHYFKSWELFDQIMVSPSLVKERKKGITVSSQAYVFSKEWMLYKNNKGEMVPSRTYSSGKYYAGYSDHLPVTLRLYLLK
jgi:endonuclease/exonuclease/phosphatase family metal-dependent hydrolase